MSIAVEITGGVVTGAQVDAVAAPVGIAVVEGVGGAGGVAVADPVGVAVVAAAEHSGSKLTPTEGFAQTTIGGEATRGFTARVDRTHFFGTVRD